MPADIRSHVDRKAHGMNTSEYRIADSLLPIVKIDVAMANSIGEENCPHCSGPLHVANYIRSPAGHGDASDSSFLIRQGLCCGREGCRKRLTPPSALYLGRFRYTGITIFTALSLDPGSPELRKFQQEAGFSHQALGRWRRWYVNLWSTPTGRVILGYCILCESSRRQFKKVLAQWTGSMLYMLVNWQLFINALTGGKHWTTVALKGGGLGTQRMDLRALFVGLTGMTLNL